MQAELSARCTDIWAGCGTSVVPLTQCCWLGPFEYVSTAFRLELMCLPAGVLCACCSLGVTDSRSLGVMFCLLAVPVLCDQKLFWISAKLLCKALHTDLSSTVRMLLLVGWFVLLIYLALIIFLFLIYVFTVFETLGKHGVVERLCGSFMSQIPLFLHGPFFFFLPAKELVTFPVWLCGVIPLLLMDFAFEIVPSVWTALMVNVCSQAEQNAGINSKVLHVIHIIKVLM